MASSIGDDFDKIYTIGSFRFLLIEPIPAPRRQPRHERYFLWYNWFYDCCARSSLNFKALCIILDSFFLLLALKSILISLVRFSFALHLSVIEAQSFILLQSQSAVMSAILNLFIYYFVFVFWVVVPIRADGNLWTFSVVSRARTLFYVNGNQSKLFDLNFSHWE